MLSKAEEEQNLIEQIADHLIDRDDYFADPRQCEFLEWAKENSARHMDGHTDNDAWVQDFDIDSLYDEWVSLQEKEAA